MNAAKFWTNVRSCRLCGQEAGRAFLKRRRDERNGQGKGKEVVKITHCMLLSVPVFASCDWAGYLWKDYSFWGYASAIISGFVVCACLNVAYSIGKHS